MKPLKLSRSQALKLVKWAALLGAAAYAATRLQALPEPAADESKLPPSLIEMAAMTPAAPDGPAVRVLFVGNSLTHYFNMPGLLLGLARTGGVNLEIEHHSPPGWSLAQHVDAQQLGAMLDAGGWDAVVLQEQTQLPALRDERVTRDMVPPATAIARRARAASPSMRLFFYMTPAWRDGDTENADAIPQVGTYSGMQDRVAVTYRRVSRELNGRVAPAGEAWRRVRRERPDIVLYGDPSHPNKTGAYLTACVFYASLFGKSPEGLKFYGGVDPSVAAVLQRAAWESVQTEP